VQGIAVATGLQQRFDWKGVAASAAGAAVGQMVGSALGPNVPGDRMGPVQPATFSELGRTGDFLRAGISGFAGGLTTKVLRGGRVDVLQVAIDAFGNALGQSLASAATGDSTREPLSAGYENEMSRQSDAAYKAGVEADLFRASGDFVPVDGSGYRGMLYEPEFTGSGLQLGRTQGLTVSQQTLERWSADAGRGIAGTSSDPVDDTLQALYYEKHPPLPEYLPLADSSANPPLVEKPFPSKPGFWSGLASTAATIVFGSDNPARMTPQELETWRKEHPTARFGELPTIRYDVDFGQGTINRVIDTTPPVSEQLKDIFSLGFRPVGRGLGTFAGGLTIAGDESLSREVRTEGAYDAGAGSLSVPAAALMVGAPGIRIRQPNWIMGPNDGPQLPAWGGPVDYSILPDALSVSSAKVFTRTQKANIYELNRLENSGLLRSDMDGTLLIMPSKSQSGVTPPRIEAQVDHRIPRVPADPGILPGTNSYRNAQLLSRQQNRLKWNN
jgi:hypothetical protein